MVEPEAGGCRDTVAHLQASYEVRERLACGVLAFLGATTRPHATTSTPDIGSGAETQVLKNSRRCLYHLTIAAAKSAVSASFQLLPPSFDIWMARL